MNRTSLRAAIVAGRARLDAALADLSDDAMLDRVDEGWTRKDVLAHLEAWERRVVEILAALQRGERPPEPVETDQLNAAFHARDRHRSLADVRAGEADAHAALLRAVDEATDEELFDGSHFGWTEGEPFADWIRGNADEHSDEHLEQLTRPAR